MFPRTVQVCRRIAFRQHARTTPTWPSSGALPTTRLPHPQRQFHRTRVEQAHVGFKLADIGEGIAEVEIMQWFVKPGDKIAQFDKVCEVQSDKATVEITSRYDGVVVTLEHEVGGMAKVGENLVVIDSEEVVEQTDEVKAPVTQPADAPAPTASATAPAAARAAGGKVLTSPAVRRIARENGLDLGLVTATGPGGRTLKADVLAHLAGGAAAASTPQPHAAAAPIAIGEDVEVEIKGLQRIMVKSMTQAAKVPHFLYCDEVELDNLIQVRTMLKPQAEKSGVKLSYFPFIIKAASQALKTYPQLNAHANEDCSTVVHKAAHNIGFAMDTPRGLMVPNIKNVQSLSVLEIAFEIQRLIELGMDAKLGREDLSGGTFTLSNIGAIGGTYAAPILVVPEVVIGALGKMQTVPRFAEDGTVVPKTIMSMSWSGDHRVVDGATMARFSNLWKDYLESPSTFILHMR
jgi:2-oxoisovalerate dehydrogenase E2 component (dihydrolipoyl transacylase)